MFNDQFRFSENFTCEKIFTKITFTESLPWPMCNCLLCNEDTMYTTCTWQLFRTKTKTKMVKILSQDCLEMRQCHETNRYRQTV